MSESADVAVTIILTILIIVDIIGNCLVCFVIKGNQDMRQVESVEPILLLNYNLVVTLGNKSVNKTPQSG